MNTQPSPQTVPDATRVYTPGGRVAHLLEPNGLRSVSLGARQHPAVCGLTLPDWEWRGTGGQWEYERAAALPLCSRCAVSR